MAQKNDEIITDTLIYYYEAGKRLDKETGERLYEQYMTKPDETENFILKVPVYISRPYSRSNTNKTTAVNETIFLLPGGSFASLDKNNYSNADQCTAGLQTLLSTNYTTILIDYQYVSENNLNLLVLRGCLPGLVANNLKYKQLKASLICFWSLRDIVIDLVANATTYSIDTENMMMTGVSAGGYLTLMYMLMEESEIPTTVGSGANCGATWPNSFLGLTWGTVCSIPTFMREDFWLEGENRLPPMKGYMPMNSGVLFNDFLNEDAFLTNSNPKLNLLHGTCDEIIFQGYGKIPYKCIRTNASPYVYGYTSTTGADTAKYNYSYGSAWVYSAVKDFVSTRYDQVCGGGHKPHCNTISRPYVTPQSGEADVYGGTWNVCNKDNPTSSISITHKLKEWIEDFADEVFTNSFTPGIGSLIPELASQGCSTDVTNLSNITNITVTAIGGGGYTATTVGGVGAAEYDWSFQGCYSNGSGTGGQSGTSTLNTITIPAFASAICKLTVSVTAKNGCGGNKTYTKVINYSGSCNNCSASSKTASPLNEDITETVLLLDRQLEINVKNEKIAVLNLYSIDGVLLKEDDFQLLSGTNRLDIDKLYQPSIPLTGIYLLQVVGEGISSSFRIFIQR